MDIYLKTVILLCCSYYYADVGKTRQAVKKSIDEKTWNSHVFPKMKEMILNLLGFEENKTKKNDKEVEGNDLVD